MDVTIREARPEDDAAIGELLVDAFLTQYAKKMPEVVYDDQRKAALRAVAEKRAIAHVWVALKDGKVIGTVSLFPPGAKGSEAWSPDAADLRHLATAPEVHGLGYSKPLLDVAEAKARALGARSVQLHVRRGAHGVARMYMSRGYLRVPGGDLDKPNVYLEAYEKPL